METAGATAEHLFIYLKKNSLWQIKPEKLLYGNVLRLVPVPPPSYRRSLFLTYKTYTYTGEPTNGEPSEKLDMGWIGRPNHPDGI
jgi:hypothetical protein